MFQVYFQMVSSSVVCSITYELSLLLSIVEVMNVGYDVVFQKWSQPFSGLASESHKCLLA